MDAVEVIKKFGKPSNSIGGFESQPLMHLSYGFLKFDLPKLMQQDPTEAAEAVMEHSHENFRITDASGNEIAAFLLWIKSQLEKIAAIEQKFLSSEPEPELMAAGVSRLNEFGDYATVDGLAKGDILKHEAIKALSYYEVYQKLKLDKTNKDIEKDYQKIMEEKARRK